MIDNNQLVVGYTDEDEPIYEPLPALAPCGRCGGEAYWEDEPDDGPMILCRKCGNWQTSRVYGSLEATAAAWNDQPLVDSLRERLEGRLAAVENLRNRCAELEAERDALRQRCDEALDLLAESNDENDALRGQLAATQAGRWILVEDDFEDVQGVEGNRQTLYWHPNIDSLELIDESVNDQGGISESKVILDLGPDLRLCKRVDAAPRGFPDGNA